MLNKNNKTNFRQKLFNRLKIIELYLFLLFIVILILVSKFFQFEKNEAIQKEKIYTLTKYFF